MKRFVAMLKGFAAFALYIVGICAVGGFVLLLAYLNIWFGWWWQFVVVGVLSAIGISYFISDIFMED